MSDSQSTIHDRSSLFSRHPWKLLYTTFTIATLPLRICATLLYYIPKSLRQHPKWTYHQAVGTNIFSIWWNYASTVEYRGSKTLKAGSEKERFVVIEPGVTSLYQGIINRNPAIQPKTIGGVWYTAPPPAGEIPKLVVIHFHGGAYVLGGARQMESGWGPEVLSKAMDCPVLQPQYRLSGEDNCSFPAAIQDGITAYAYVLKTLRVRPENVVLSGDSAGGNLVLTMLRYLSNLPAKGKLELPLPRAALLWSPWLNLAVKSHETSLQPNFKTDYIPEALVSWGTKRYIPKDMSVSHPYLTPLGNEYKSQVPLFLQTGTAEIIYDDHLKFAEAMAKKGTRIEYLEIENAPHDTFGAGMVVGFAREAEDAAIQATNFVKEVGTGL